MADQTLKDLYNIGIEIDTGAKGWFARVYEAYDISNESKVAFKLMRHKFLMPEFDQDGNARNHDREWNAFLTEVRALSMFSGHSMVTDFFDCGYVNTAIDDDPDFPEPDDEIVSYKTKIDEFMTNMDHMRAKKWRPYIVTEYINRKNGTYFIIAPQDEVGKRFPTHVVLELISQFVDLLMFVQDKGFIYGDHKLAHTYWVFQNGRLKVIDWNGGKFVNEDREHSPKQLMSEDVRDLILKIMYSLLTKERPIEFGYRPEGGWTSNLSEIHLPDDIAGRDLLQEFFNRACNWEFENAKELRIALDELMVEYGYVIDGHPDPEAKVVEGKEVLFELLGRMDDALSSLKDVNEAALKNIHGKYPKHIREEFASLVRSLSTVVDSNELLTDVDFLERDNK